MATPTTNFVPYSTFNPALLGPGSYVASGYMWGTSLGSAVTLDYSFPTGFASHASGYSEWNNWFSTSTLERAAVRGVLATWARFANVAFVETSDTAVNVGELRFAYSSTLGSDEAAHAYFPFNDPSAGDVWFNPTFFNSDGGGISRGSYDYLTILHEVGHALGLKHSFEAPAIPAAKDNYFYSIMSYTASPWSAHGDNFASFYPTTPMYYDLLALEAMYGVHQYQQGNNVYQFREGHKYWQAIHDTGGVDTIVYVGSQDSSISLRPGQFSKLSDPIAFQRADGSTALSRATVTIGPNVIIENARGGSGNDVIIGNGVHNVLSGGLGNDRLLGLAGSDYLHGGLGNDVMFGGADGDRFYFETSPNSMLNHDTVRDFTHGSDVVMLNNAVFTRIAGSGPLADGYFHVGAHAADHNDFIVYYRAVGKLFYDDNANGAGHEVLIATFTGRPVLDSGDFRVV